MSRVSDYETPTFGISDLVTDKVTLAMRLSQLEAFLISKDHPFAETMTRSQRENHVRRIIRDILNVGGIVENLPEFKLIKEFYSRNFGTNGCSYLAYDVTLHRSET